MQVIIPMSGRGARFERAGYSDIKPLIEVDGRPIIEHVVNMFPGEHDFLFICARDHLETTRLRTVLEGLAPGGQIVAIDPHKLGPVHSALEAAQYIKDDEPVVLNYCDFSVYWDYGHFKGLMEELKCHGCITAYRGFHPHSLGPNLYAYMREKDNYLVEIQEKYCFTDNKMGEFASAGAYYFKDGRLLKHYFNRAVDEGLETNGEYYASMPYNMLLGDDLDVYIYELENFLQWGTPEDLEEYQSWSEFFAHSALWKPDGRESAGTNLIPMAGEGTRFRKEGYSEPKPLVPVAGVPMVERSLDSFPPARNWIALCRTEHIQDPGLVASVRGSDRNAEIVPVLELTEGQACTCLLARDHLDPEQPLFIGPCDSAMVYSETQYLELTDVPEVDCLVWTFRNHSHANRNPTHYGWIRTDSLGNVQGVSCKTPVSDDVRFDPGVTGAFWFRKARFFLEAADALIAQDRRINNEFYVDSAIDVLVEQGRKARVFDIKHYICFGTPDDVKTYEYWFAFFSKASHHPFQVNAKPALSRKQQGEPG
jgi:NDP-sugar pyrophosphorylase family protein